MKLYDLQSDKRNANKGSPRGDKMIEDSLRQYGAGRSILIDKHGKIIAGNKTVENAGQIGMDDVIVVQSDGTKLVAVQRTDLDLSTDRMAKELAIADNRSSQVSLDWDVDVLKELATEIELDKFFSADELEAMWPTEANLLTDEDDVPPVPVEPVSKLGDLYTLGDHRLLCGDSTCITDVERLMDGKKADMVFTDPPYGVNYTGGAKKRESLANDQVGTDIYGEALPNLIPAAADHAALYLWYADAHVAAAAAAGYVIRAQVIWVKNNAQFVSSAHYHGKHEPCFYAVRKGKKAQWFGGNTEVTVWPVDRANVNEFHPTQKPVALAEHATMNSSKTGDIVLDLFGGSGSTLIACEKTGRRCYMMELSPAYTDVIVARWEAATGKKAVLNGR